MTADNMADWITLAGLAFAATTALTWTALRVRQSLALITVTLGPLT